MTVPSSAFSGNKNKITTQWRILDFVPRKRTGLRSHVLDFVSMIRQELRVSIYLYVEKLTLLSLQLLNLRFRSRELP